MKYLASPYSHPDPAVRQARYEQARDALAWLLKQRIWTYSPIVHCHELALVHDLPKDHLYWWAYDAEFLRHCDELIVLHVDGWKESKGVAEELQLAILLNIPRRSLVKGVDGNYISWLATPYEETQLEKSE